MNYRPLDSEIHAGKGWHSPTDYVFAADQALVPIVARELSSTATKLPLAFIKVENIYQLVGLLGLERGRNLFVRDNGKWLEGIYVPAAFRTYPFRLLRFEGESRMVLCIDEESELIGQEDVEHRFFEEGGTPSKAVREILQFLQEVERSRHQTELAVSALAEAKVIRPWPIKVRAGESEGLAKGLYKVDEAALNALDADAFLKLRKVGALPIAYAQMLSTGLVEILPRLEALHARKAAKRSSEFSFSDLNFNNLS